MWRILGAAAMALPLVVAPAARAADPAPPAVDPPPAPAPAPPPPKAKFRPFRPAGQLANEHVAAALEGAWSFSLHVNAELVSRSWDAPYPTGTIGQYSTRILYGATWTAMLGLEAAILLAAHRGRTDWIAEANYRTDWIFAYDLPACPRPGASGGCGVGIGGYSFIQIRPKGWRWWIEAGGGWIQQRVFNDETRTVNESSWALSPVTAFREAKVGGRGVALRLRGGPGAFIGMHNGHVHPTLRGKRQGLDVPWHQIYPFDFGVGPGVRTEANLTFFRRLSLDAELVFAPLFLGAGSRQQTGPEIAPLDSPREGTSVFRKLTVGVGWDDPAVLPMKTSVGIIAAELSGRPVYELGHHAVVLRFDVPLGVAVKRDQSPW
jgi:hypothetical protein